MPFPIDFTNLYIVCRVGLGRVAIEIPRDFNLCCFSASASNSRLVLETRKKKIYLFNIFKYVCIAVVRPGVPEHSICFIIV